MKRKLYFMAGLAALAMLFAACSNLGDVSDSSSSSSSSNATRNGSDQTLTISLTDASFDIARTVYPGDWTSNNKSQYADDLAHGLVYVLTGYTVDNENTTEKGSDSADFTDPETPSNKYIVLEYEDLMNGIAQVNLKPLVWYFTLTAYGTLEKDSGSGEIGNKTLSMTPNSEGVIENTEVCLIGTIHADMTGGENKVTFNMVPPVYVKDTSGAYTVETSAIGTAKYNLSFNPPDSFWYMHYAFYPEDTDTQLDTPNYTTPATDAIANATTSAYFVKKVADEVTTLVAAEYTAGSSGALPTLAEVTDGKAYNSTTPTGNDAVGGHANVYAMDTITNYLTAGKYWFRAEFYDTNNKRLLIHTEKFVIDGINTSEGIQNLNYKTFSSAPQNITELALEYTYNEQTFDEDPVSLYSAHCARDTSSDSYPTTYTATLTWEDVADNEIGYQLWLRTYDSANNTYEDKIFTPSDLEDASGEAKATYGITSLQAGITTTQITLNTGVKYQIRIRAYNDRSVGSETASEYGTVWGTYALSAKDAGYDYFVPYIPRTTDYDETDADTLAASDIDFGLFTIDYNLNGGKIKQTSAKTSSKLHYTIPYIYKESVNKLVDTDEFPYIDRTGYDFIGWNELYGSTGVSIDGNVLAANTSNNKAGTADKYFYKHPNYGATTFNTDDAVETPTGAAISLDSIIKNNDVALTKSEVMKVGSTNTVTVTGSLATYTWTVTLDAESTAYEGHVSSVVGSKYIYSNLLEAGSAIPEECVNRELYASWETPLSMSITLPAYPSFKLTKIAAAGDPVECALYSDSDKNNLVLKASDKLSDLAFTIYYDDATDSDATNVFTSGSTIVSIDATGTGTDDTTAKTRTFTVTGTGDPAPTLATLVIPITVVEGGDNTAGTGGTFTWNYNGNTAGVYILKVTGTYTYGTSKTNSLAGQSDVVEGYIYIRLTN